MEPPASLVSVAVAGLLDVRPGRLELGPVRRGNQVDIVERHRLVARVVHSAHEYGVIGHGQAALPEFLAHAAVVQNLCQAPGHSARRAHRRRRRSRAPTRAGCSCWSTRVRSPAPAARSPTVSPISRKHLLGDVGHLVEREPLTARPRARVGSVRSSCSRVVGGSTNRPAACETGPSAAGRACGRPAGIDASTPTTAVRTVPTPIDRLPVWNRCDMHAQRPARPGAPAVLALQRADHLLDDIVSGPDHGRAKGNEVRIGRPSIVHRDREEARRAVSGRVGGDLFDVPAQRLLALVDAEDRLESRNLRLGAGARACKRDGVERSACRTAARRPRGRSGGARAPRTPRSPRAASPTPSGSSSKSTPGGVPNTCASWNTRNARCSTLGGQWGSVRSLKSAPELAHRGISTQSPVGRRSPAPAGQGSTE